MDIRDVSEEEKKIYIDKVKDTFEDIRNVLTTLEQDMISENLMTQASSVWIAGNFCTWYADFMTQIREIDQKHKSLNEIKEEIEEVCNEKLNKWQY
jgi:flagellar biosynthesis chaperone FliJ